MASEDRMKTMMNDDARMAMIFERVLIDFLADALGAGLHEGSSIAEVQRFVKEWCAKHLKT